MEMLLSSWLQGPVQVMKHVVSQLRRSTYIKEKRIYQLLGIMDHGSDGLMDFSGPGGVYADYCFC